MITIKTRIIVSAVLLPIFFAVLFVLPTYVLTVILSVICAIAAFELIKATKIENKRVLVYTIISAVFIPFAVLIGAVFSLMMLVTLLLSVFFFLISLLVIEAVLSIKSEKVFKFRKIPIALAGGILIPLMLSALVGLKSMTYGHLFVLLPIIAAFMTDSGAYFTGMAMGKHKPFPNISPNKTVEGFVGGIIAGTVGMMIYGIILSYTTSLGIIFPVLIVYGVAGAIVTELGDLVFSLIKRKCCIKDYGNLIPGHGGALDRFDSMTFAAPTMYLLVKILPAIVI